MLATHAIDSYALDSRVVLTPHLLQLLGAAQSTALTATFLASTPMRGINGCDWRLHSHRQG